MCSAVFYSLFGKRLAYETSQVVYRLQIILCERVGERIALCLMVHSYPDIVCSPTYLSTERGIDSHTFHSAINAFQGQDKTASRV